MRITLRWGRSRDHQLVALFGCSGVRVVRVGGLRHHAAQYDEGTGTLRFLLLRYVRRRSFCGGLGDGADSPVAAFSCQFSVSYFRQTNLQRRVAIPARVVTGLCPVRAGQSPASTQFRKIDSLGVIIPAVRLAGLRRGRAEGEPLPRGCCVPAARTHFCSARS